MRKHALCWLIVFAIMSGLPPRIVAVPLVPSISGINVVVACNTSALINFTASSASSAFIEYGTTTSYGSSTIHDTARRYKEHAIPITGLNAGTLYHYRIVATDSGGTTTGSDQTLTTSTNSTGCPELPIQVDTRMPDMSGAVEETVKVTGGTYTPLQFPIALNIARLASGKRIITVDTQAQGVTLTGPFVLGNKIDNNWIVVRSSAHASLAEGRRVTPSDTASLVKITTNNVGSDQSPIQTAAGAHNWRLIGVEVTIEASAMGADAPGGNVQTGLIRLGTAAETSESQWPHHITIDRCYVHGLARKNTIRGVYNNGTDNAIIDSYFDEFHGTGNDSQAILHGQGRRLKMVNNTLIAAGEPFMSGGIDFTVSPVTTPSDFEFTHNYIEWKLSWKSNDPSWDGIDWVTKNHWESKNGKRYLIFATVFNRWWSSEQTGGSIAIKSSNDEKDPTVVSSDIVWYKNHHKNLGSGFSINGSSWPDELSTDYTRRLWVIQNLLEINGTVWNDEEFNTDSFAAAFFIQPSIQNAGGSFLKHYPDDMRVIHNTFTNGAGSPRQILRLGAAPTTTAGKADNLIFRDSIVGYGSSGIKADGFTEGNASLDAVSNSATRIFSPSLIAGSSTNYPTGNTYVANFTAVKFVNFNNGLDGNYRLASDSPGKNAASDGTDMGADIDAVERATQYATTGNWQSGATVCRWSTSPACQ